MKRLGWIMVVAPTFLGGEALAQNSASIFIKADTAWITVQRTKTVSIATNDSVTDGCWKNPVSSKTAAELEFIRSGFKVDAEAATYVVLHAVGYKVKNFDLCIVGYTLSLSVPDMDHRYDEQHKLVGFGGYKTIFSSTGVMSGPDYDMSDRLKEQFSQASQAVLVQAAKESQRMTDALVKHENKVEANYWLDWLNAKAEQ